MKKFIIIFEGIDGVGKTTLAKGVAEQLNFPYIDPYFPLTWGREAKRCLADYSYKFLEDFLPAITSCIIDRFFGSEYVYSTLFNRRENPDEIFTIEEKFTQKRSVKFINIIVRTHRNIENYDPKADDLFVEYSQKTKFLTLIVYNDDFDRALKAIVNFLKSVGVVKNVS
ncbi:MAG: hypothetical protein ACTSPL_04080 [Candidatus Odinarchaeia archaeon]